MQPKIQKNADALRNGRILRHAVIVILFLLPGLQAWACKASFTYTHSGSTFTFTNTSAHTGSCYYYWSFGDGSLSTAKDPVHTYTKGGRQTIALYIMDSTHCNSWVADTIYFAGCTASFNADANGADAHFTNTSYSSTANPKRYTWHFGDGNTSHDVSPVHTYARIGTYIVWMKMEDSISGCSDSTQNDTLQVCGGHPSFTYTSYGPTVTATNTSTGYSSNASYYWNFGDGIYSPANTHTYPHNGTYIISFIVNDSGCWKSHSSDTITISKACDASFTYDYYNGTIFKPDIIVARAKYKWYFGDGQTSTDITPVHRYTKGGKYTVALVMEDTLYGCKDSLTQQITPDYSKDRECRITFHETDDRGHMKLTIDSVYHKVNTFYISYGDGSSDSGTNMSWTHDYAAEGNYTVCITTKTDSCIIQKCTSVTIYTDTNVNVIQGFVRGTDSIWADEAMVYLIQYDSAGGTLTAVDSLALDTTGSRRADMYHASFSFRKLGPARKYMVKAALRTNSAHYTDHVPAYSDTALHWRGATVYTFASSTIPVYAWAPIMLQTASNPGGPGFVGGLVSMGANKKEGDPLGGIELLLLHPDGTPAAYTYSDDNGKFSFSNLAYGDYILYAEVLGKNTIPSYISISAGNETVNNIMVKVSSQQVTSPVIVYRQDIDNMQIYPNPVSSELQVNMDMGLAAQLEISVIDYTGKILMNQAHKLPSGKQHISLDVSSLSQGVYTLRVYNSNTQTYETHLFIKSGE